MLRQDRLSSTLLKHQNRVKTAKMRQKMLLLKPVQVSVKIIMR